jgi:leader peptidase (prepilin peptidase)/N-methyltransferase
MLAVSDIKWRILPHPLNNLFILTGFIFRGNGLRFSGLFTPATSFIILGSLFFGMMMFFSRGLGGGDIKMISGLAIWLGILKTVYVIIFACFTASIIFFILFIMRKVVWKWLMPFGPFLAFGAFVLWFWPQITKSLGIVL